MCWMRGPAQCSAHSLSVSILASWSSMSEPGMSLWSTMVGLCACLAHGHGYLPGCEAGYHSFHRHALPCAPCRAIFRCLLHRRPGVTEAYRRVQRNPWHGECRPSRCAGRQPQVAHHDVRARPLCTFTLGCARRPAQRADCRRCPPLATPSHPVIEADED